MSFILDALKKSESDRQRQSGPSLFEVKVTPPRRALPVWAVAIAVLLGINVIVVSWMLLRRPAAQQPAAVSNAPAAAPAPAAVAAASGARTGPAPSAERAAAAAVPATAPTPAAATPSPAATASSSPPPAATPASATGSSGPGQVADQGAAQTAGGDPSDYAPAVEPGSAHGTGAQGGDSDDLPLYQQIVSSAGLPELHLDLHVFAERPQDRFVMINMQRLGEGDSLPNGVHVDAIRPDGVALSYRGIRFLLPRN